ncbi:MAG: insulinase family protein [Chitinophagaceae bacterium]|nr:insulinase family protein [Chitinophagaceae bacterium]
MNRLKQAVFLLFTLILTLPSFSQLDLTAGLPTDPKLSMGKLSNGLTYYIRENRKPEKKVELRLVVKVGSIVEDDDQQGLAHMAEHMAFNGTKNFKKNEIVSYLQSIGVEFGNDLNAYTSFDETVYILPIPTDQPSNLEKGFQILEDWAHQVTYFDEDINSERAIILEESRLGKSGEERMFKKIYPELFKGSQYANRLPIGVDSIIKQFNPDAIRRYYRDWYRPDLMAVIVTGEYQSSKAMVVADKEATGFEFGIIYPAMSYKRATNIKEYKQETIQSLYASMLSNRLQELVRKENPPFVFAYAGFDGYARNFKSFMVQGSTGTNDVQKGIDAALTEVERLKRFGFTAAELERAKKNLLSNYEKSWNNRDKTESENYAAEYIRNFVENEPIPGIDYEFELIKKLLPTIQLSEVNAVTDVYKNEKNRFSFVMGPDASNIKLPTEVDIVKLLDARASDASIKPYEEKAVAASLLRIMPSSGKTVASVKNAALGTTELTLSNGIKVTLKKTDFKDDQILLSATRYGGTTHYGLKDKYSAENAVAIVSSMGVGEFSPVDLGKSLAGKVASVRPVMSQYSAGFSGNSANKDVETMFQLLYLYVTSPRKDSGLFNSYMQRAKAQVSMLKSNPQIAFIDTLYSEIYNGNPLAPTTVPKMEHFEKIQLARAIDIYKERLGDVGGMHFTIVGSFDEQTMVPLLEKYIASLPAKGKSQFIDNKVSEFTGVKNFQFRRGKEDKSLILGILHGDLPYSEANALKLLGLSDALNILIIEEMREKIQGIYGGGTNASLDKIPTGKYQMVLQLPCGPDKVDTLISAFNAELKRIAEKGLDQSYVDKIKKAWIEKRKVDIKKNEYWLSVLQSLKNGERTVDRILNGETYLNTFSTKDLQDAAKIVIASKGKMMAVQMPEVAKK